MADRQERFANLLGRAAMDVWGDMPRDIQEALFETAMKGHDAEREELVFFTNVTLGLSLQRGTIRKGSGRREGHLIKGA
jgi:hypothetical protein